MANLEDLEPGETATVDVATTFNPFGQSLSDKVIGSAMFGELNATATTTRQFVRHNMVDQLTYDPMFGSTNVLAGDGPVVLAWGSDPLLDVVVEDQKPRHLGNVLYFLPADLTIRGKTTFRADLMRNTVVGSDAQIFSKEPTSMSFGRGSATIAYRPIAFEGTMTATELVVAMNGDPGSNAGAVPIEPLAAAPPPCPDPQRSDPSADPVRDDCDKVFQDGLPEVEVFDTDAQAWKRLPHLSPGTRYAVADPARYVDPTSGAALIRFVNDRSDQVGFQVDVAIGGTIE